jgi:hypothetical protein
MEQRLRRNEVVPRLFIGGKVSAGTGNGSPRAAE